MIRLFFLFLLIFNVQTVVAQKVQPMREGTIRILAIGYSFSEDALENYLHELALDKGQQMIIGNFVYDRKICSYRKINQDGSRSKTDKVSLMTAITDEKWDYVCFQQVSSYSGQYEPVLAYLPMLHAYIKDSLPGHTKYVYHQTWAYQGDSKHKFFPLYQDKPVKSSDH